MQTQEVSRGNLKISVVMAVFEGEHFIRQQLDSILCQTIIPDEIVICDDSSNDKTYKAIENAVAQYNGSVKYYKNKMRLGVSKNFEKAISLSSGDVIFLSDQDDIWKPNKIAQLISLVNASPNCGGAFCNSELVDADLNSLGITHWDLRNFSENKIFSTSSGMLDFFLKRVPIAGHNMVFRSELKDLLLPFPDLVECHDTWIGLVIKATNKWVFTSDTLTQFRQHDNNLSQGGRINQFKTAIASIKSDTFTWNMNLYNELINRLSQSSYCIEPKVMKLLEDRRNHSAARSKMNCNIFKRFPLVYGEIKNKRYFKYGRGWKNVIQDLILRSI
jgi:glycosyltransferase involved in cell wall biosynthesis